MEVPYTDTNRPDTGLYNAKVGIWLFLASEVMLFGALFSAYILLRVGAMEGHWPTGLLDVGPGFVNTLVLILSSVTVVMAWASLKLNNFKKFKLYQGITVVCALLFVIIKSFEYKSKFTHHDVILNDGIRVAGHLV
ncbi:MAG: cytochrome c oxidase subunit 3, partial [Verrucomicrobiota bacterium]|nr:cytochrome c oxidase subunit 3 [Verrucomicrobiota bacterium]